MIDVNKLAEKVHTQEHRNSFLKISCAGLIGDDDKSDTQFHVWGQRAKSLYFKSPTQIVEPSPEDKIVRVPRILIVARLTKDVIEDDSFASLYATEAIQVSQERMWHSLVSGAPTHNHNLGFRSPHLVGDLDIDLKNSAKALSRQLKHSDSELRVSNCFLSSDLVAQYGLSLEKPGGYLGSRKVDGHTVNLYTDAYREPEHRVLNYSTLIHVAAPLQHGFYYDSGMTVLEQEDGSRTLSKSVSIFLNNTLSVVVSQ